MAARQPLFPVSSGALARDRRARIAALCIAWLAQYGFGLAPCELCYWQRYGYWAAIALGVVAILQPARSRRGDGSRSGCWRSPSWRPPASPCSMSASSSIGGKAPPTCTGQFTAGMTPEELHKRDRERADRALRRAGLDHVRNLHGGL